MVIIQEEKSKNQSWITKTKWRASRTIQLIELSPSKTKSLTSRRLSSEIYKTKMKSYSRDMKDWKNDAQSTSQTIMLWQNNVVLSGIPELVSEDVLEESVISVLADIDVFVTSQDIDACHRFGKPDRDSHRKQLCLLWTGKTAKFYLTRKNLAVLIAANTILHKIKKVLQRRIWHP